MLHQTITRGLALSACCLIGTSVLAQQATTQPAQRLNDRNANRAGQLGSLDETAPGGMVRASQLIGMNIYNNQEESVGEINDLVINSQTGRVEYAAVTYGGFLGLGDKMYAVPFQAFSTKADADDADDPYLMLNVTQEQLEGSEGFDQDNWPNFADRNFTNQVDKRYGVDRRERMRNRRQNRANRNGVSVDVNRNGANVEVDTDDDNE